MKNNTKYSIAAIFAFSLLLPIILVQFLYLQNISILYYREVLSWLIPDKESYQVETYHAMTLFILWTGFIRINKEKKNVYIPVIMVLVLSIIILCGSFFGESGIHNGLQNSALALILCSLLMFLLHKLSYDKFNRPCTPAGLRSMNKQTSTLDIVYMHVPILLVIASWFI